MALSLNDLNLKKKCDSPAEMELLGVDGKDTGVKLMVLGGHSEVVSQHVNRALNDARRNAALAAKRGRKTIQYTPIEDDIEFGIESVAVRIVGWSGITEPYSQENALALCASNAEVCRQVREFSEDIANFTKG